MLKFHKIEEKPEPYKTLLIVDANYGDKIIGYYDGCWHAEIDTIHTEYRSKILESHITHWAYLEEIAKEMEKLKNEN